MNSRVFNFYSGPATLPLPVLEKARNELTDFRGTGMSVMELSHRSDTFLEVIGSAEARLRALLSLPHNYRVLFLQGGATLQFSMVPMNFLNGGKADYVVTGTWSEKARSAAAAFGTVNVINNPTADSYTSVPEQQDLRISKDAAYVHHVSNETIDGVEFPYDVDGFGKAVVCDASSNILSKPIDVEKYALIYAGAQKNIGPSGVTVVIVRDDLLARGQTGHPGILRYDLFAANASMPNTPNTWGIYIIDLVCEWLQGQGGLAGVKVQNEEKADKLYSAIDSSDGFYLGNVDAKARSKMNVTFRLGSAELESEFCERAAKEGLVGLRGHRSVGGVRASIYNAFPAEGVERLVKFMKEFADKNG